MLWIMTTEPLGDQLICDNQLSNKSIGIIFLPISIGEQTPFKLLESAHHGLHLLPPAVGLESDG